jgi:hypothetical protein
MVINKPKPLHAVKQLRQKVTTYVNAVSYPIKSQSKSYKDSIQTGRIIIFIWK